MKATLIANIENYIDGEYLALLNASRDIMFELGVNYVGTEFILLAMLRGSGSCGQILKKFGVNANYYYNTVKVNAAACSEYNFTSKTTEVINRSKSVADACGSPRITPEHLLYCILNTDCTGNRYLKACCAYYDSLLSFVNQRVEAATKAARPPVGEFAVGQGERKTSGDITSVKGTPIEPYGVDLTEKARQGLIDPVIGREKETERIINTLLKRTKNDPIIIGEPKMHQRLIMVFCSSKVNLQSLSCPKPAPSLPSVSMSQSG